MKYFTILFLFIYAFSSQAQNRNNIWCFGHHASVNFNNTSPLADSSSVISRGSCASICDTTGNLLFYASDDTVALYASTINGAKIYSYSHLLMQNGDSINAQGWYYEIIIIPYPGHDSLYFVFTIGVTSFFGIYYSLADLNQNGGLGKIIQKNIQLQSFEQVDCLTAIKHGNGRDWWILFRKQESIPGGSNNDYYEYLITPSGISNVFVQSIGSLNSTNSGNIEFNANGTNMMYTNLAGLMEYYDFDRCTGIISNPLTIYPEQTSVFNRLFWDGQFSPSGNIFYTTLVAIPGIMDSCYLVQYNLNAPIISLSADTLLSAPLMSNMGQLKLAPDKKIYLSTVYNNFVTSSYPYPDTVYSIYNSNLSVINSADSLGTACNFQPWSFYLDSGRTYIGLPNNPDYDMPRDSGSVCDTIQWTGINEQEASGKGQLFVTYVSVWDKLFINAQHLKGTTYTLTVTDIMGRQVFKEKGGLRPPYFTRDLDCTNFSQGMYIITLITNKEQLSQKFIKE